MVSAVSGQRRQILRRRARMVWSRAENRWGIIYHVRRLAVLPRPFQYRTASSAMIPIANPPEGHSMPTELHLTATVLPGHRIEVASPELPVGEKVELVVK